MASMIEFVHKEEKTEVYIVFTQPQQAVGISFRLKSSNKRRKRKRGCWGKSEEGSYHVLPVVRQSALDVLGEMFGQDEDFLERVDVGKLHKRPPQREVF